MKKYITIGNETFLITVSKTTVTEDSYSPTTNESHTWTVKAFHGKILLYTDKTRTESHVLTLVRAAHEYIEKGTYTIEEKTLEQKLTDLGFNK